MRCQCYVAFDGSASRAQLGELEAESHDRSELRSLYHKPCDTLQLDLDRLLPALFHLVS